jgi:uncharacterized protein (TIGR03435 family)
LVNKSAEEYSIQAVMPAGSTPNDIPKMIKALRAERCRLVAHRIVADQSAYALVVAKKGAKLRPAREVNESRCSDAWQEGYAGNICRMEQTIGDHVVKTQMLATLLSGKLAPLPPGFRFAFGPNAPYTAVADRTGISGK